MRFKQKGSTKKTSFTFDSTADFNSKKNPILLSGDIIIVRQTRIGQTAESIKRVAGPVFNLVGIFSLLNNAN